MWRKSSRRFWLGLPFLMLCDVVWAQPKAAPATVGQAAPEVEPVVDPNAGETSLPAGEDRADEPLEAEPLEAAEAPASSPGGSHEAESGAAPEAHAAPVKREKPQPAPRPRSEPKPQQGDRESSKPNTHDGFYARFGTGFGSYDERFQSQANPAYGGRVSAQVRGIAGASEIAMGGTPYEGLVIGGGIYSADVLTSTLLVNEGRTLPEGFDATSRDFSMVALFMDRYFVPTLGVHFQAALGVASQTGVSLGGANLGRNSQTANGPGLMLGFGYETWMLDQWSLGALARTSFGVLFSRDKVEVGPDETQNVRWVHYVISIPEFLMTVTYH